MLTEKMLNTFIATHALSDEYVATATQYFVPLAEQIVMQCNAAQSATPFFVGINGCQGSGKSTLADFLAQYLTAEHQLNVVSMSLDDFYLTGQQRQQLAIDIHPLFATRGVPGTHDVALLKKSIEQLKTGATPFCLPKFDKASDEPAHIVQWPYINEKPDIVILEGWCWGVPAESEASLKQPVNELEQSKDSDGAWRSYVNQQIIEHYQPLYQDMDYWVFLQAPSFDCVYQWRLEQEQKLRVNTEQADSKLMSAEQVANFIQYFQRLTMQAIKTLPAFADYQFSLASDRHIQQVISRGSNA